MYCTIYNKSDLSPDKVNYRLTKLHISLYRQVKDMLPQIEKVLNAFDGKVVNKRLDRALESVDQRLSCNYRIESFGITWFPENRSVINDPGQEYSSCLYVDCSAICLINDWHGTCIDENRRLCATQAIQHLRYVCNELQAQADKAEEQLTQLETLWQRSREIRQEIEDFNHSVNSIIDTYYHNITLDLRY